MQLSGVAGLLQNHKKCLEVKRVNFLLHLCVLCGSHKTQPLYPYTELTDWFSQPTLNVFTAR